MSSFSYLVARCVSETSVCILRDTEEGVQNVAVKSPSRVLSRLVAHEAVDEGISSRLDEHTSERS